MAPQQDQRARVHDALIDLCFERGFKHVELDDLLARAGLDRPVFDRHFADLEDCFFQVFKFEVDRYQREAAPDREPLTDWRGRVRASAYALFRFLAADQRLGRFVLVESRVAGERTQVFAGQQIEALFDLIDEGRQELADPGSITRATAEAIGGGVFNQLYAVIGRGAPLPPEREIVPQLMYCIVLPYAGRDAAHEELAIPPPPSPAEPSPPLARRG
ncbi:MAG TPA: TetR/AcrR family transcriptional regulator [Solirubrobacterales bacterium]|nr:TetR/AcrR family transcriptional regulator [Solirubrobacterales bacterium]